VPQPPLQPRQPPRHDPNLTVLPAISAPVDEGVYIPKPPRSAWDRLLWLAGIVILALAVLAYAFLHANPMH
jgi:hypothetical protein